MGLKPYKPYIIKVIIVSIQFDQIIQFQPPNFP